MELNKPFMLPAVLGAVTTTAQDENHRILSLQFGKLSAFSGMRGKLIVGEDSPWNNVRPHMKSLHSWMPVSELRTAIHVDGIARDPPRVFACQKGDNTTDVVGLRQALG